MLKSRLAHTLCVLLVPVLLQTTSFTQQQPVTPSAAADRRVALNVVVTDSSGKPVSGLKQQDFTLKVDKERQDLNSFRAVTGTLTGTTIKSDPPVEIILVLDTYNAAITAIAREREGIHNFLAQNNAHLARPVTLAIFTGKGTTITSPSLNGNALINYFDKTITEVRTLPPTASGFYGKLERFNTSISALQSLAESGPAKRPGRKLVIWIGHGWPYMAGVAAEANISPKEKEKAFEKIVATAAALRRAQITLYNADAIETGDVHGSQFYRGYLKPAASEKDAYVGNLGLEVIATQTGGQVLNSTSDLAAQITTCIADADAFYVLSFESRPAAHVNEYHDISVTVAKPDLTARTLTGYYNQP
jgi:VWFA-related protein